MFFFIFSKFFWVFFKFFLKKVVFSKPLVFNKYFSDFDCSADLNSQDFLTYSKYRLNKLHFQMGLTLNKYNRFSVISELRNVNLHPLTRSNIILDGGVSFKNSLLFTYNRLFHFNHFFSSFFRIVCFSFLFASTLHSSCQLDKRTCRLHWQRELF